jgi:hypothetical protein
VAEELQEQHGPKRIERKFTIQVMEMARMASGQWWRASLA